MLGFENDSTVDGLRWATISSKRTVRVTLVEGQTLSKYPRRASLNDLYSNVDDTLTFVVALMGGELFRNPTNYPVTKQGRNRVIWPLIYYGLGMMPSRSGASTHWAVDRST